MSIVIPLKVNMQNDNLKNIIEMWKQLSQEEKRREIAALCGYIMLYKQDGSFGTALSPEQKSRNNIWFEEDTIPMPDYINDLNAINKVIKSLYHDQIKQVKFLEYLDAIIQEEALISKETGGVANLNFSEVVATAEQLSFAFFATMFSN